MNNISTIACPGCNRPVRSDKKACFYCGKPLQELKIEIKCSNCGSNLNEHENFCTNCGQTVVKEKSYTSGLPELPENFMFPTAPIRSIICREEYMDIEKGRPPVPDKLYWNKIRELNCYRLDVYEDDDEISPVSRISIDNCLKFARLLGKRFDRHTTDDNLLTYYIFEICYDSTLSREILIDYNFNYGKALGSEKDFNRLVNFKKLVRKIVEHLPNNVILGNGTTFLLAG